MITIIQCDFTQRNSRYSLILCCKGRNIVSNKFSAQVNHTKIIKLKKLY